MISFKSMCRSNCYGTENVHHLNTTLRSELVIQTYFRVRDNGWSFRAFSTLQLFLLSPATLVLIKPQ